MHFLQFCHKVCNPVTHTISSDRNVPEQYEEVVNTVISTLKNKTRRFDSVELGYIERAFEKNYVEILKRIDNEGFNPDCIMNVISDGLYKVGFNELNDRDKESIIKTLTIYILISKHK